MEKKKEVIICVLAIILTLSIGISIKASETGVLFDKIIMEYIHNKTTSIGIFIMERVTFLGSAYFIFLLGSLILVLLIKNKNLEGIKLLLLSTIGSLGLNFLLKGIFIRTRPLKYFLIDQGGYSYPSGHAMVSMSFYTTMTYLLIKNIKSESVNKKKIKSILWVINFIIVLSIGFSRLYLGVHWPTDVFIGYILGYVLYHLIT